MTKKQAPATYELINLLQVLPKLPCEDMRSEVIVRKATELLLHRIETTWDLETHRDPV